MAGSFEMHLSSENGGRDASGVLRVADRGTGPLQLDLEGPVWNDTGESVWGSRAELLDAVRIDGELHSLWDWGKDGIGWLHGFPGHRLRLANLRYLAARRLEDGSVEKLDQGIVRLQPRGLVHWARILVWTGALTLLGVGGIVLWRRLDPRRGRSSAELVFLGFLTLAGCLALEMRFGSLHRVEDLDHSRWAGLAGHWQIVVDAGRGDLDVVAEAEIEIVDRRFALRGLVDNPVDQEDYAWKSRIAAVTSDDILVFQYDGAEGRGDRGDWQCSLFRAPHPPS